MSDFTRQRLSIHNVTIGMELAEGAITPNGMLLIPKDTIINEKHIFRMNLYQILSVVIKAYVSSPDSDDAPSATSTLDVLSEDMRHQNVDAYEMTNENFAIYKNVFFKVESLVKTQLNAIGNGHPIDVKSLISTTEALMSTLRLKSELFTYMNHLKSDNSHTYVHSINVAMLCNIFGHWLKLSRSDIDELTLTGLLHDIGKTKIDEMILDKPGRLTHEEFDQIKQHARLGYELIKHQPLPEQVKLGVLMHHERNDGSGYPLGLKGESIPVFGKIIAIVDVYDAMTSSRSYHQKFSPFKVIQMFEQESYGYLDTKFLFVFLENIAHNYLGERALLSDGREVKIVFIHNNTPSRPIVQSGDEMIDLQINQNLYIEEIL